MKDDANCALQADMFASGDEMCGDMIRCRLSLTSTRLERFSCHLALILIRQEPCRPQRQEDSFFQSPDWKF
jgi:hypothetical protein